jgi:hypothetical protein
MLTTILTKILHSSIQHVKVILKHAGGLSRGACSPHGAEVLEGVGHGLERAIEEGVDLEVLPVSKSQRNVNHRWVLVILVVSLISNN